MIDWKAAAKEYRRQLRQLIEELAYQDRYQWRLVGEVSDMEARQELMLTVLKGHQAAIDRLNTGLDMLAKREP